MLNPNYFLTEDDSMDKEKYKCHIELVWLAWKDETKTIIDGHYQFLKNRFGADKVQVTVAIKENVATVRGYIFKTEDDKFDFLMEHPILQTKKFNPIIYLKF